jgi:dTMP kinase
LLLIEVARRNIDTRVSSTSKRDARIPDALAPDERHKLDDVARDHVRKILAACHGNQTNTARMLGLDRKTLARRIRKWGLRVTPQQRELECGSLVAIEGIDGSGITSQALRLVRFLEGRGHRALYTSEPTASEIGALIRRKLSNGVELRGPGAMRTLSLLFAADRIEHYHAVVAPALARGITVVSDRWYHSSLAYQRTGVEREWISSLNRYTRTPEVAIILDVPAEVGHARRAAADRTIELFHDLDVQREVVGGYRATIAELRGQGERIEVIDGAQPPDAVFAAVLNVLGLERRRGPRTA